MPRTLTSLRAPGSEQTHPLSCLSMVVDIFAKPTPQGFFSDECGVTLGGVVLVQRPSSLEILCVRKASKPDYEFSGMWSMPGGMIRWQADSRTTFPACCFWSMASRCRMEAGVDIVQESDLSLATDLSAISSYTAKGARRFVRILPFQYLGPTPTGVVAGDASVSEVRWWRVEEVLPRMTPANALLLWAMVGDQWQTASSANATRVQDAVAAAEAQCSTWAVEAATPRHT